MKSSYFKVILVATALLLNACSAAPTHSCFSDSCKLGGGYSKQNVGGGGAALSNSYNQYGSSLLHD